jgi:hypothetical protein
MAQAAAPGMQVRPAGDAWSRCRSRRTAARGRLFPGRHDLIPSPESRSNPASSSARERWNKLRLATLAELDLPEVGIRQTAPRDSPAVPIQVLRRMARQNATGRLPRAEHFAWPWTRWPPELRLFVAPALLVQPALKKQEARSRICPPDQCHPCLAPTARLLSVYQSRFHNPKWPVPRPCSFPGCPRLLARQ